MVYLIVCDENQTCKIGVSNNPERRLAALQTANPFKLRLVHCFVASDSSEALFHKRFSEYRLGGEWFSYTEESGIFKLFQQIHEMNIDMDMDLADFGVGISLMRKELGNEETDRLIDWAFAYITKEELIQEAYNRPC